MSAWQPIETPPKDGTRILIFVPVPRDRIQAALWDDRDWEIIMGAGVNADAPTHWLPLPEPPK